MKRRPAPAPRDLLTLPHVVEVPAAVPEVQPELPVAVTEVLGFPIRWLAALPVPSSLLCSFADGGGRVVLRASAASPVRDIDPPVLAFVGPEVAALALAAEHDRAKAATLRGWLRRKVEQPAWRLTSLEAVGGLGHPIAPAGWATGRVLWTLGLRLDEVWS